MDDRMPTLPRRFGLWSTIGLACVLTVTWEGWLLIYNIPLTHGGTAGSIFSFLLCWIGYYAVVMSLGELVSAIPLAGGQYQWTYVLAHPDHRKWLSWFTGMQTFLAWQFDTAGIFYLCATIIQGLINLHDSQYQAQRWHTTAIMITLVLFSMVINTRLVGSLPLLERGILFVHLLGFVLVISSILWYGDKSPADQVFNDFESNVGYSSGLSFFVGMIGNVFAFGGLDG